MAVRTPIIDFHFHVTTADEYTDWFLGWLAGYGGEETVAHLRQVLSSPQAMLEYLDEQGVDYAIALAETNPLITGTSPNERVVEFCKASERLIPFANINPYLVADLATELRHCVVDLGCRGFWYDAAFFLAQLHNNVYMEITGLPPQKLPLYFPNLERNADKILFGSDWPALTDIRGNISAIQRLNLSEESKAKILGGNAARLLGMPT
jgi:predicted TIM-barrel fold metal-dependent hydrolase